MAVTWADVIAIEPLAADVDAAARTIFLDTAALLVDVDEWGYPPEVRADAGGNGPGFEYDHHAYRQQLHYSVAGAVRVRPSWLEESRRVGSGHDARGSRSD